jgi:hypothetical protein
MKEIADPQDKSQREVDRAVPCSMLRIIAAFGRLKPTSPAERPIHLTLAIFLAFVFLFGCESTNYVPPVTPQMATASLRRQDVDLLKLREGRTLFVHRCIECHTLPAIWRYSAQDWPGIVNSMSHRASLKPAERDAIIAYILAARATER